MQRLTEVARAALWHVYDRLPRRNQAVLWGWPDHEDSILALEAALQSTSVDRVIVLVTDPASAPPEAPGPKTVRITKDSVRGWLAFATSRYVFFTHRCFMRRFPENVVSVNVWHGMPIKRIGRLSPGDDSIETRHVLATSPYWGAVMGRSMVARDGVLVTGLPRNDRLRLPADRVRGALADEFGSFARLIVWLPTFRRSVRGRIVVDGQPTAGPFEFPVDLDRLDDLLDAHDCLLVVKPHPMADQGASTDRRRVRMIDDDWLHRQRTSLYRLVGGADVLVTDVSSVMIDYLLLDRPVVHAMSDLDAYERTRGLSVPLDEVLAGPLATSSDQFLDALAPLLTGLDPDAGRRAAVRSRSHADIDDGATRRLLHSIGLNPSPPDA